jgi:formylglycine-generating enzyme required for sulfatase activity
MPRKIAPGIDAMKRLLGSPTVALSTGFTLAIVAALWSGDNDTAAQEGAGKKVALLVGVNKYDKRGFRDLEFAERDVQELAKVLEAAGYDVHLLTGGAAGERRAVLRNIEKAVETVLAGRTKKDLILVALAGHGLQIEVPRSSGKLRAESFFCPADAEQGNPATMLPMGKLFDELDRRGGDHNLVLIDACREDPTRGRGGLDGSKVSLAEGIAALFGCRSGQKTFETRNAGGGHGVFFHFVLEGLRGQAKNSRGEVTWSSLADYVAEHVPEQAPGLVGDETARQTPNEVRNLPGRSPVLLTLSASAGAREPASKKRELTTYTVLVFRQVGGKWEQQPKRTLATADEQAAREYVASVNAYDGWKATSDLPETLAGRKSGQEWDHNSFDMKFCWCSPGRFTMGTPKEQQLPKSEDQDQVSVTISRGFWLAKYEVTQADWKTLMGTTVRQQWELADDEEEGDPECYLYGEGDRLPIYYVSHDEATEFCRKLTARERKGHRLPVGWEYRLPTEAQWEYACRAGAKTLYHFGDGEAELTAYAWYSENSGDNRSTHEVGEKRPNAWGLHDMHGNVNEWCRDRYAEKLPGETDPEVTEGFGRMFRGGSSRCGAESCRLAIRRRYRSDRRNLPYDFAGIRVALVKADP